MCRHAQPKTLAANVARPEAHRATETRRWDDEHVYRCHAVGMIAKERLPALRRGPPPLRHVFCNCGLADIDPELEQLAVNPWHSPQGVGTAHLENELANVRGNLWAARAAS
jgi:hypothetical protein